MGNTDEIRLALDKNIDGVGLFRTEFLYMENSHFPTEEEQIAFDEEIETGMMMETPASVLLAEEFAKEADFFSIGTNGLTQYLLVVDRGSKRIVSRCDAFRPAVIKAVAEIIRAGHKYNRKVGMCGELAGDVNAVQRLLELGLDEFSMSAGNIDYVRKTIIG